MRSVIKLTILLCFLSLGFAQTTTNTTSNSTGQCTNYNSTANASQAIVQNGNQTQNIFAQCPPGLVPGPVNSSGNPPPIAAPNAKVSAPPTRLLQQQNNTNNTNPPPPNNNTNPQPNNNTNPQPNNNTNPPNNNTNNNSNPQPAPANPQIVQMGCVPPHPNGDKCQNGMMCQSHICIYGVCSAPATSGQCQSEGDTADGYFCNKGTVTKCYAMNSTCYGNSIMECYHGACNKRTMLCDTFSNALANDTSKPALLGGDSTGFKSCTLATVNQDCVYNTTNGSQTAGQLGFQCLPTLYAPTVQYFCQMGGGEPTFREMAKAVRFSFLTIFSWMQILIQH